MGKKPVAVVIIVAAVLLLTPRPNQSGIVGSGKLSGGAVRAAWEWRDWIAWAYTPKAPEQELVYGDLGGW